MKLGRIDGKVWSTIKDEKMNGCTFYIMQPIDEDENSLGMPLVAVDTIGSREGDLVYWVGGAEATFAFDNRQIPSDATIVGLVDRLDLEKKK
jgi:ethanolamine utilization protein EutN